MLACLIKPCICPFNQNGRQNKQGKKTDCLLFSQAILSNHPIQKTCSGKIKTR